MSQPEVRAGSDSASKLRLTSDRHPILACDILRNDFKEVDAMDIAIRGVAGYDNSYPYDVDLSNVVRCHAMLSSHSCEMVGVELGEEFAGTFGQINPYRAVALLTTIDDSAQGLSCSSEGFYWSDVLQLWGMGRSLSPLSLVPSPS
jgi:hypothetical protein